MLNEKERATFLSEKILIPEVCAKINPYLKNASIKELVLLTSLVQNKSDPN